MQELDDVIKTSNYAKVIMLYNNKGLHSIIEKALGISSYNLKALEYLKNLKMLVIYCIMFSQNRIEALINNLKVVPSRLFILPLPTE